MRLTLDIDGEKRAWWAWGIYYMLREMGRSKNLFTKVEIRKTRKGYHVVAAGTGLTEMEILILRMTLGDDALRTAIDSIKHPLQPKQVLWIRKNGYEVEVLERWENESG
jgi:hypothetical protein